MATVAIVDAEKGAFRPLGTAVLLRFRLHDVEDNGHSVFVVVADDALVGVCAVGCDDTVAFGGKFGGLVVRHELLDVLDGAGADLLSDGLVEVLSDHGLRVGSIVVTFCPSDAVLDQAG